MPIPRRIHDPARSACPRQRLIDLERFPQQRLLRILARLLDRITRQNDHLRRTGAPATPATELARRQPSLSLPRRYRPAQSPSVTHFELGPPKPPLPTPPGNDHDHQELSTAAKQLLANPAAMLTFHAKLVPLISIEAYLLRILKYCPTPNGVFLSVMVYLDRLCNQKSTTTTTTSTTKGNQESMMMMKTMRIDEGIEIKAEDDTDDEGLPNHHQWFIIDSWNVHRFLIANVTAASKLFSDVFYTNSRYAKVGGLPLEELDELEVKFLLINDFRLGISGEEFVEYAEGLLGGCRGWGQEPDGEGSSSQEDVESASDSDSDGQHWPSPARPSLRPPRAISPAQPRCAALQTPASTPDRASCEADSTCSSSSSNSERSSCSTVTPSGLVEADGGGG